MEQFICLEDIRFSEDPPKSKITLREAKSITLIFKVKSDGSQPLDTMTDDGGARKDFWTIAGDLIYLPHVEPRVKLFCAERRSCTIVLQYIDVVRRTNTTMDVLLESRIDD